MLIKKEQAYYFNSATEAGAIKIGDYGNHFSVQLDDPISIPQGAKYCTLFVNSAGIWNTSPNISSQIGNNKLYFTYNSIEYVINIEDGLYGVSDLDSIVKSYFINQSLPQDLFEISGNDSTQRILIRFNYENLSIDFTPDDSCKDILGFNSEVIGPFDTAPYIVEAPNTAAFNRVVRYYIKTTLISAGIPQNARSQGIISSVPIDVRVGSLINFRPILPSRCDATELIGQTKQRFEFILVDQLLRPVSTAGEEWQISLVIEYYEEE